MIVTVVFKVSNYLAPWGGKKLPHHSLGKDYNQTHKKRNSDMRGLKATALALAVSAVSYGVQAEIKPLGEAEMGNVTGQAGVTILLRTKLDIGEFRYTDQGSLSINDISIGGTNRSDMFDEIAVSGFNDPTPSENIDNVQLVIDVFDDGDLGINVLPINFQTVDVRIATGQWNLVSSDGQDSTTILDNFQMDMMMGGAQIRVDTADDSVNVRTSFAIDDLDADAPFLAMGIRDMWLTGADYDPSFPYILDLFSDLRFKIYETGFTNLNPTPGISRPERALAFDLQKFDADIGIGSVLIGGQSIGSVGLDNFSLTNTQMRIYGH